MNSLDFRPDAVELTGVLKAILGYCEEGIATGGAGYYKPGSMEKWGFDPGYQDVVTKGLKKLISWGFIQEIENQCNWEWRFTPLGEYTYNRFIKGSAAEIKPHPQPLSIKWRGEEETKKE